eukprot:m.17142 g.17142  ORF g.17142 m.17142 type:complete len:142 (+) comp3568_c0_seq2:32-457(+)
MFTTLNDALGWRASPALPDPCTVLLTEDGLDGGFLVHHFLSMHAKGGHPVLLVSFTQALAHYVAACRRLGVNLQSGSAARCLTFVDGVSNLVGLGADVDGALSLDLCVDFGARRCFRTHALVLAGVQRGPWNLCELQLTRS